MSDHIGIVMGGYLDENQKLMSRSELNHRIYIKDQKIKAMEKSLKSITNSSSSIDPQNLIDIAKGTLLWIKEIK